MGNLLALMSSVDKTLGLVDYVPALTSKVTAFAVVGNRGDSKPKCCRQAGNPFMVSADFEILGRFWKQT